MNPATPGRWFRLPCRDGRSSGGKNKIVRKNACRKSRTCNTLMVKIFAWPKKYRRGKTGRPSPQSPKDGRFIKQMSIGIPAPLPVRISKRRSLKGSPKFGRRSVWRESLLNSIDLLHNWKGEPCFPRLRRGKERSFRVWQKL